jgi:ABC-type nitrate/sulfonate/bicarbonate transport system substrate-binding protein
MLRRGPGLPLFVAAVLLCGVYLLASRLGYLELLEERFLPNPRGGARLSDGDFPAGVAAPVGDIASVPLRPTLIGFTPRGSSAALLVATGGVSAEAGVPVGEGLFRKAYALEAAAVPFTREEDLRRALSKGAEHGGVDLAIVSVDRFAHWAHDWRDAAPATVMLLGRSRGQEALAALGVERISDLRGKRVAVYPQGPAHYFGLWLLARANLSLRDVRWVRLKSTLEASKALREGKADAALGYLGDVALAAKDRGGKVLATTADAPHLIATVLVTRGEFAARYPDAVRRVIRGLLDAAQAVTRDPGPAARLLGDLAPYLGDPLEAIESGPPATLQDNLAFFGLSGEAPVTYDELFTSAGALFARLESAERPPAASETRDLGALRYIAEARGP